ncbi:succinyl-CoA synthetase alpha subunit [Methylacidimicrobium cyclopophantes]|uniref:Succinate--CoA ligase [ADP-forming] subunit alpha n=1 Tax=Methylacidimicrobium cyclopophantes TaxID=1041766 RepID=A0A5E6M9Q6_9BACT|nr:succinate--CoA ligase subunit alpha [Methylacidimicrobium cyclopophantes]VVM05957.1 succinyl-CoA synthetase alpha subunit [Methylacidimicrobium cyclopophantes]
MSILVDRSTRVVVQGITGRAGSFHARACLDYGTNIVAGVTPGKGGQSFDEAVPIFDSVIEAKEATGCTASLVFVPAPLAADAILEAAAAEIDLIICITEGIPILDMIRVRRWLERTSTLLIGPNCPGVITPGQSKLGIMPAYIHRPGPVGIVSRSGTLTYEAVWQLSQLGIGQSSCIGIGGDPIHGLGLRDVVEMFDKDPATEGILIIGEIGGCEEQEAAAFWKISSRKPAAAFLAGATAPVGRRMGHAGAIVSGIAGTVQAKIEALESAGISVIRSPAEIGSGMVQVMATASRTRG